MKKGRIAGLMLLLILSMAHWMFAADTDTGKEDSKQKDKQQHVVVKVVVTANKLETPENEVGSSISVITSEQIERMQKTTVADVLKSVPSLDVVSNGGPGGTTSVFIRGAKSEHTLVLIDGTEMNDPASTGRGYDFAHLTVDNIQRIEVLRGPQSTLYGSDAMGGVINIITKKGEGKPTGSASLEGGQYNSFRGTAGASGGSERVQYSLGFSHWDTDGISAADRKDGNLERDGYANTTMYGRMGVKPAQNFDLDLNLRYIDAKSDLDSSAGVGGDDPNYRDASTQLFFRTQGKLKLLNNKWEQKLGFSLTNHDRTDNDETDAAHPDDSSTASYMGRILKFDWQNNFYLNDANTVTFGIETEKEEASSEYYSESAWGPFSSVFADRSARTTGYYLQDLIALGHSWFTTVGVRWDDHSIFGVKTTYRVASTYRFRQTGTSIKGTYGTGFKAPTLYQLYSSYGDLNLKPEESTGWDFGLEQSLINKRLTLGATIFHNEFDSLIDFENATYKYINIARADTKGLEIAAAAKASESLDLRLSYTYTSAKDITLGEELIRRPANKLNFNLNYAFRDKGNANLEILYVGERIDNDFSTYPASRVRMDGYVLFNPAFSYRITDTIEMFGRVENLFNRQYEQVKGFGTPGISAYGGFKVHFNGI